MINRLFCRYHPDSTHRFFSGIQVAIEARKIAAGNVHTNLMSDLEDVTRRP